MLKIISKLLQLVTASIICNISAFAQVNKQVVVEHFTNTRCSVCASRNPGFYNNLNAQDNVLHIAFHPSAPYSACELNKHNTTENDSRTNFYNIYGSTPRLVVQGNIVSASTNYSNASLFTPYLEQTAPLLVSATIDTKLDSIIIMVVVKAVSTHTYSNLLLATFAVEEKLNYISPNGEQMHHDVFRKSFFETNGKFFLAPSNIGDSVVFSASVLKNSDWNLNQIYALAMVQEIGSKQMVQAARSSNLVLSSGVSNYGLLESSIAPNPFTNYLHFKTSKLGTTTVNIFDVTGKKITTTLFNQQTTIHLNEFPSGIYFVELSNAQEFSRHKLIKK